MVYTRSPDACLGWRPQSRRSIIPNDYTWDPWPLLIPGALHMGTWVSIVAIPSAVRRARYTVAHTHTHRRPLYHPDTTQFSALGSWTDVCSVTGIVLGQKQSITVGREASRQSGVYRPFVAGGGSVADRWHHDGRGRPRHSAGSGQRSDFTQM